MARHLVTGGAGFIGSRLARALIERGDEVWVVDDLSTGRTPVDGATLVEGDVADPNTLARLPDVGFDSLLHLAAQSSGEVSHADPAADATSNVLGTLRVLEWARSRHVARFVHASSMAVYGSTPAEPIAEDAACLPLSFYGVGKLACEHYIRLYSSRGVPFTIFRMFNVYGPGQDLANKLQGMVSIYLAPLLKGEPILVRGSADRHRDFVHVADVIDAWLAALDDPRAAGRTYNLATGCSVTVRELLDTLIKVCGEDPAAYPVVYGDPTPGDQLGVRADVTRISSELGWLPRFSLEEGIRDTVNAYRAGA